MVATSCCMGITAAVDPMQRFLQAQNIVNPLAYMSVSVLLLHTLLTWIAVYVLEYGLLGAALTLSFLLLTVSSAVMLCLEIWYSQGLVLISGLLADPTVSLDSISICMNYLNWDMEFMLGLSASTSVRVSNELGAVLSFRVGLSKLFTSDVEVIEAVSDLTPLLAISVFLNGIQPILSGVAIGSGWQSTVAYVNLTTYYVIGLPIGCVLGFKTSLGVAVTVSSMRIFLLQPSLLCINSSLYQIYF
ncbi:hypothetical protein OIU77_019907 [Salix suchowensis]|uniref:Uncharacterized protein n=1 Tax=Salix suchowensis TaxID=1278906 RepID=A0ABQ9CMA2_9ROSI|nr:hypothetical protein OIU77_019907 [Salix suchowensis]